MAKHLDEMQSYIKIAGNIGPPEEEIISEEITVNARHDVFEPLLIKDLVEVIFKLKSYRELHENQNYALGIEEGFCQAAGMLDRLLDKYRQDDPDE